MLVIPKQLKPLRKFKEGKRRELAAAEKALDAVRFGCAFMPHGYLVSDATGCIRRLREQCSQRNWGR